MSITPSPHTEPAGNVLRALRKGAKLSLRGLAALMPDPKVHHSTIDRVERGEIPLTDDLELRLAQGIAAHLNNRDAA